MNRDTIQSLVDIINGNIDAAVRELHQLRPYELIERLPGEKPETDDIFKTYTAFGQSMRSAFRKVYFNRPAHEVARVNELKLYIREMQDMKRNLCGMAKPNYQTYIWSDKHSEPTPATPAKEEPFIWKKPEKRDIEVHVNGLVFFMTEKEKDKYDLLMHKLDTEALRLCEKEVQEHKLLLQHMRDEERQAKRIRDKKLIEDYNFIMSLSKEAVAEIYDTKCVNTVVAEMEKTGAILPPCKMCRDLFGVTTQHRCNVCAKAREHGGVLETNLNKIVNPEVKRPIPETVDGIPVDDYIKEELLAKYRKVDTGVRIVYEKIEQTNEEKKKPRWFLKGLTKEERKLRLEWLVQIVKVVYQSYPGITHMKDAVVKVKGALQSAYYKAKEDIHSGDADNIFNKYIEPAINALIGIERPNWTTKMVEISEDEYESFYDDKEVRVEIDARGNRHLLVRKFVKKAEFDSLEKELINFAHADEGKQDTMLRGMAYYSECPYMENGYLMESFIRLYHEYGWTYGEILRAMNNKNDRSSTAFCKAWAYNKLKDFFVGALGQLGLKDEDYFFKTVNGFSKMRTREALKFYGYIDFLSRAMSDKECTSIKEYYHVDTHSVEDYFKHYSITNELMG